MSDPLDWLPGLTDPVEIGRGGFGVVYRVVETDLNRAVAVKILSGNLDELALQRFDRERRAMGALSGHPNIVGIYRSGLTEDSRPYLVMEYLPGGSMAERVTARGHLTWQEAADVGVRLCAALETAHRAGVLHRDVKPENVFLSALGAPKLGDFGIARLDGAPQTQSATITASLAHAAPELIDGRPPSVQSDVYGLASTILTLITGRPPFSRDTDESIVPLLARIATEPVPNLRGSGVPDALCLVFEKAMAKDQGARYGSVAELGRALQDAQRTLGEDVTPLEVQGIDPRVTPGQGAPRVADPTIDLGASAGATVSGSLPLVDSPAGAAPGAAPPVAAPTPVMPPAAAAAPTPVMPPAAAAAPIVPQAVANSGPVAPPASGPLPGYTTGPSGPAPAKGGGNSALVIVLGVVAVVVLGALIALLVSNNGGDSAADHPSTTSPGTSPDSHDRTSVTATTVPAGPTTLKVGSEGENGLLVTAIPFGLGAVERLDDLAASCSAGDLGACDDLVTESPTGSNYDAYGRSCGGRVEAAPGVECVGNDSITG